MVLTKYWEPRGRTSIDRVREFRVRLYSKRSAPRSTVSSTSNVSSHVTCSDSHLSLRRIRAQRPQQLRAAQRSAPAKQRRRLQPSTRTASSSRNVQAGRSSGGVHSAGNMLTGTRSGEPRRRRCCAICAPTARAVSVNNSAARQLQMNGAALSLRARVNAPMRRCTRAGCCVRVRKPRSSSSHAGASR